MTSGIKEIRTVMQRADENRRFGARTIVFVDEIHRFNREINSHIVNSRLFLEGKVIMGYLAEPGEVNIDQSLQTALNMGKTVCVPQILEAPGEMAAARLVTLKKLGRDRYGIRTPQEPVETIAPEDIDLVLTPGLGFTAQGERLGRGSRVL